MIAPLTKFIGWPVLQTAEVIGCLGQMSVIFWMVFLATALPVFSFNARADSADGPQTNPHCVLFCGVSLHVGWEISRLLLHCFQNH